MNLDRITYHSTGLVVLILFCVSVSTAVAEGVRVENGSEPRNGTTDVVLQELWTVGNKDSEIFFGLVVQVIVDQQGNVYLLDAQLSEVLVLSASGKYLYKIGREGDGPGEFRSPQEIRLMPDGSLGVLQGVPAKIERLDPRNGSPLGAWPLWESKRDRVMRAQGMQTGSSSVLVCGSIDEFNDANRSLERSNFIAMVDIQSGFLKKKLAGRRIVFDLADPEFREVDYPSNWANRFDLLPDDRAVIAVPHGGYEFQIFTPDGNLDRTVSREYVSWPRDDQAIGVWRNTLESARRSFARPARISWEANEPDIQTLYAHPSGEIWVLNSRGRWAVPEGVLTVIDVFDGNGVFTDELKLFAEGNPRQDMLFFAGDDLVFQVRGFMDAAMVHSGGSGLASEAEKMDPQPVTVTCYRFEY